MASDQTTTTELAILPRATLPTILAADSTDILGRLAAELANFEPDATTSKGRAEIGSKARMVGEAKMNLVRLANSLTEGWRQQTAAVVAERKTIEERMDVLRKQIEATREEYNAREKRRTDAHEAALAEFTCIVNTDLDALPSKEIVESIDYATDLHAGRDWEEYSTKAAKARTAALEWLRAVYQTARAREDEAEAARIAAEEQAEREREAAVLAQIAREERIAAEAAEAARLAAEAEAERLRVEAEERAKAQLQAAEALRQHQADEAARREREAAEALALAESERLAGIERERLAAEKAEADRIAMHKAALAAIPESPGYGQTESSAELARRGRYLLAMDRDWQEFAGEAKVAIDAEVERTRTLLAAAQEREAAALDAERLERARLNAEAGARAVEADRQRVAQEAEAAQAEADRRAADTRHRGKINREARAAIIELIKTAHGSSSDWEMEAAHAIVVAIAKLQVPHVTIKY